MKITSTPLFSDGNVIPTFLAESDGGGSTSPSGTNVGASTPPGATGSTWLLMVHITEVSTDTVNTLSGWDLVIETPLIYIHQRLHDGATSTYNFTKPAGSGWVFADMYAFNGCAGVGAYATDSQTSTTPTAPSFTNADFKAMIVKLWGCPGTPSGGNQPTGYTSLAAISTATVRGRLSRKSGTGEEIGTIPSAAASSVLSASSAWDAIHFALKPT